MGYLEIWNTSSAILYHIIERFRNKSVPRNAFSHTAGGNIYPEEIQNSASCQKETLSMGTQTGWHKWKNYSHVQIHGSICFFPN